MNLSNKYTKKYPIRRITNAIIVFLVIVILNFLLPRLMPGNFALYYYSALLQDSGGTISAKEAYIQIEKLFNLNRPLYIQFLIYLHQVFSFPPNFGPSFEYYPIPAWDIVFSALKWTLLLLGTSQLIAWTLGIFLGVYLALNKDRIIDRILQPALIFMLSIPPFWLGIIMIIIFAIILRVLPPTGAYGIYPTPISVLKHLVLPMSVIVLATLPSHTIVIRNSALEVLSSDFAFASIAQGLKRRTLIIKIIRNSILPSLTQLFLSLGWLFGGIYTVEYTFSYPGVGTVIANAVYARDYPVLEAALFITALAIIISNLAADLIYPLVDPRVSYVEEI
ncbi:ABC transporter permease [Saccharolobus islandicus]|uniref:Binding-protein-dependent transport systems inner membrane component n=1 Tax=Saccharolobus islandicus (strain L.D.8.5 / Lassen \|nr:ABC transporter permease [Sulfolobus islandicus]ADB86659.1 binding-protein-dependent transport systems inner membrane component [Sulfolobus islandicus L.D.8.5]